MTEYDEQDQAYQDLLEEANECRDKCTALQEEVKDLHHELKDIHVDNCKWVDEVISLKATIKEMCDLIHYQANLKHQDAWLKHCISRGLYTIEEE